MPVRGRREYALKAVECFQAQTYPNKELLILQDADDWTFNSGDRFAGVTIFEATKRRTIGRKRNELCHAATGEIIVSFDSDDWSAPERIAIQVERLLRSGKMLLGFDAITYVNEETQRAWIYRGKPTGSSFCFYRSFWHQHPFENRYPQIGVRASICEDAMFRREAENSNQVEIMNGSQLLVARIHSGNTAGKPTSSSGFKPIEWSQVPQGFFNAETVTV